MWEDLLSRFVIGGTVVSLFALLGDVFRPKTFAGIFSAAPSVALGTLGLAIIEHGTGYAAIEAKSMVIGALALFVYCSLVSWIMLRYTWHSLVVATSAIIVWLGVAFGLRALIL